MEILVAPNPKLRVKTKKVNKITPELIKLGREMIKFTQSFTDPEGVGLSTNQIGRDERFFIAKIAKKFVICINPGINSFAKQKRIYFEGCLSIPNYYGEVKRPTYIYVTYLNEEGKKVSKKLSGPASWIFQHEIDHLNGILFMDRVLQQKGRVFKCVGKDRAGADVFEEIKLV